MNKIRVSINSGYNLGCSELGVHNNYYLYPSYYDPLTMSSSFDDYWGTWDTYFSHGEVPVSVVSLSRYKKVYDSPHYFYGCVYLKGYNGFDPDVLRVPYTLQIKKIS